MHLHNAGPEAISITKPGDSVVFAWTGCDSEHFIFVIDDDATDDRERPVAFWPIDGRSETGLLANSFPEFLEWLVSCYCEESGDKNEIARLMQILRDEFGISRLRPHEQLVQSARDTRLSRPGMVPTLDNIGIWLADVPVDRMFLNSLDWPKAENWSAKPIPGILDEAEARLDAGEIGTALILARNYHFRWWYADWKTGRQIMRRSAQVMAAAYRRLGRHYAALEIERQTEWNLARVT
jgi:hypothetical protein